MNAVWFYDYPIGKFGITEEDGAISRVFFTDSEELTGFDAVETPLIQEASRQLLEYFAGERGSFDLPLLLRGTEFQLSVWKALQSIPFGETCSYKDIAFKVGNSKACRAVGMANNRNPIAIIVPCHRVIGQNGSLVGYGGGLPIKKYLLELEKQYVL